ncbi:MAG: hypothetical protein ABSH46_11880 [Bryobacteraceae bacterium]
MRERYFVGVDLGQKLDYTAIAVVERWEAAGELDRWSWERLKEVGYRLRHLERLALGTPYPEVVARVREVARSGELAGRCTVVADATGVGGPVIDMLRGAELGCELMAVTITGGERASRASRSDGGWKVPKRDLVVGLEVMLETGSLRIAAGLREGETFIKELTGMRVKVSAGRREQFGAWREGTHDDLVLAAALACWRARWAGVGGQGRRLI